MVIVFVEDRALKLFVRRLCGRRGILCNPRMPKAEGGGWSCVLERVKDSDQKVYRTLGIIEGDSKAQAEECVSWAMVSERIFVIEKNELEEYLYEKRKSFRTLADLPPEIKYGEFKHYFNKNAPEHTVIGILSELSNQECEGIASLVRFIKGS